MAKGISLYPPLPSDSGLFGCRSVNKGTKEDHEVRIVFQGKDHRSSSVVP